MTRQTVLVLGASGFIGRRVVRQLCASDWARPLAASRHIGHADFGSEVTTIELDATRQSDLERVLPQVSGVISCVTGSEPTIVAAGHALLTVAAAQHPPPRVVWLGSLAAYGSAHGCIAEGAPLLGDLGPYSAAKAAVDRLAAGCSFVVRLRPGIVYGPRSPWWSDRIARLLVTRRLGDLGRAGTGRCNLVHVDDVTAAAILALRTASAGGEAINLGSPAPPTWNEYFRRYAQALGALPVRRISPARIGIELALIGPGLKVAERLGSASPWLTAHPAIRPWLTTLCRHDIRMDVRKAESLLGLRWLPLEAGLTEAATWFRSGERTP